MTRRHSWQRRGSRRRSRRSLRMPGCRHSSSRNAFVRIPSSSTSSGRRCARRECSRSSPATAVRKSLATSSRFTVAARRSPAVWCGRGWIDPDTGALGPGRTRTHCDYVTTVPGTDRPLVGYRLPLWPQVKALALDAAAAFPWARAIGWDIAIAERGAVLIEGNERWSPSLLQLPAPHGLMDGELEALYRSLRRGSLS